MTPAERRPVPAMRSFAVGLGQEDAAGAAALKYRWRKGPVAGPGNRLTTLKRQRSGRAKFDLRQLGGLHAAEQEQQYVMARKATFLLHQVCGRAGFLLHPIMRSAQSHDPAGDALKRCEREDHPRERAAKDDHKLRDGFLVRDNA